MMKKNCVNYEDCARRKIAAAFGCFGGRLMAVPKCEKCMRFEPVSASEVKKDG